MRTEKRNGETPVKRREFLRLAGLGGVAAGAAAAGTPGKSTAAETDGQTRPRGYRATAHVRKFYDLSRF
jgi:hypothetical protein